MLVILLVQLGHEGWELVSTWWRSFNDVTYLLKSMSAQEWLQENCERVRQANITTHPLDRRYTW